MRKYEKPVIKMVDVNLEGVFAKKDSMLECPERGVKENNVNNGHCDGCVNYTSATKYCSYFFGTITSES